MKFSRVLATLLVVQFSVSGLAQQQSSTQKPAAPEAAPQRPANQSDDDVVRITTNLVQVDAVITDSKGQLVTDLAAEELDILEDGKSQKITNLSFVSLESNEPIRPQPTNPRDKNAAPIPPVRLRPEQVRRTIAIVVDDLGLSFESTYAVRQALKNFVEKQMQSDDLVAIIRTGGGIGALQQFTSDKRQLYAAAEKVKWRLTIRASTFSPLAAGVLNEPGDEIRTGDEDVDQLREEIFAAGTLGALNYVVRGLRELPGRKSVLLISDGIGIFTSNNDSRGMSRSGRILDMLRNLTDLANRGAVVIYTMDARGLQTFGLMASDNTFDMSADQVERALSERRNSFINSQQGLNYLAQRTGGFAIRNNNDLSGGIRRVVEDQKGYYLIGYRPDESTFDQVSGRRKYHKLSLKVKRQGKFNVRVRNGFFGITDQERVPPPQTPMQKMIGALISPFGAAGVNLRLTTLYANDAKQGSVMRALLHINGRDLTFTPEPEGWHSTTFDIIAVTFGDNGVIVDEMGRKHSVRLRGKAYERALKDGFTYNLIVPIKKAGAYQLRTSLRDEKSNRIGAASQFIEVPDIKKNRLIVSGITLQGTLFDTYKRGLSDAVAPQNTNDVTAEEETPPGAGVAIRRFQQGYVMQYAFVIYNAKLDVTGKPQVQTQVRLFRNGQEVFKGEQKPLPTINQPDFKRLIAGGAMQLGAEMEPGEYVLQIVATDPLAKEKHRIATQWIDFEIVK